MGTFADSFYFIALLNPNDQFHHEARRLARATTKPLVTTTWVLVEVADALRIPGFRLHTVQALNRIAAQPAIRLIGAEQV